MAKLTGQTIAASYDQLLIVTGADGLSSSLQAVESGDTDGLISALQISTVGAAIDNPTASSATQGGKLTLFSDDGAALGDTHRLGVIEFSAAEDTSSTITVGARIEAIADAAWSGTENGADMVFYTTDADAAQSELMRLTADAGTLFSKAVTTGVDATGVDIRAYSNTTNEGLFYDASEDEFGLLLTTKLKFHDIGGGEEIYASADGHLEINSATTLDITAPTVDINASTKVNVDGIVDIIKDDTTNTGVTTLLTLGHSVSNTADDNIGGEILFTNEASDGNQKNTASIQAIMTNADEGDSTYDGVLQFKTINAKNFVNAMRISHDGSVGIGTTNPASNLHILHTDADADAGPIVTLQRDNSAGEDNGDILGEIKFQGSDSSNTITTEYSTIHSLISNVSNTVEEGTLVFKNMLAGTSTPVMNIKGNKVGIGATSPAGAINIAGSGVGANVYVDAHSADADGGNLIFRKSRNATIANVSDEPNSADALGSIYFQGADSDSWETGAVIRANADENWGSSALGTALTFHTVDNTTTTLDQRMIIDHNGNIGIGDTDPSEAKLSITGVLSGDYGIMVDQDQDAHGINIDCEAANNYGLYVTGKYAGRFAQDISGGSGLGVTRNIAETGSNPLVEISDANATNTQAALKVHQEGAGYGILVDQNGNNTALMIDQLADASITAPAIDVGAGYMANEQGRQDHVSNTMSAPSYRFDGSNDEVMIDTNDTFKFGNDFADVPFSITAWINMEDATGFSIMSKGALNSGGEWNLQVDTDDKLYFRVYDTSLTDTQEFVVTTSTLTAYEGKWIHVAATYDGRAGASASSGMTLYINGVSQAVTATGVGTYISMEDGHSVEVRIGNYNDATYAKGQIGKVQLWNIELSAFEVREIASGGSVPYKYKHANNTQMFTTGNAAQWTGETNGVSGYTSTQDSGTASVDSSDSSVHQSTYSMKLVNSGDTAQGRVYATTSTFEIGKAYCMRVDTKYTSGGSTWRIGFGSDSYAGNQIIFSGSTISNTTDWQIQNSTFVSTHAHTRLGVKNSGTVAGTLNWDNLSITRAGCIAEYDGTGMGHDKWFDKSGNGLDGTVSGAVVVNAPGGADDGLFYEEGTFTPAVSTAGGSIAKTGYYTRIGNVVNFGISISDIAATGTSTWIVSALPFTSDASFGGGGYLTQTEKIDYVGVGHLNFNISTGVTQFSLNFAEDDATRTIAIGTHFNASDCAFQVVGQYFV